MSVCCAGGWCSVRDRCELHIERRPEVSERLCPPGREFPVLLHTKAQRMQKLDVLIEQIQEVAE